MNNGTKVRGAIYVPARAFNTPQMWKDYSPEETRRDMGYAQKINLNAFRVWLSYEYWLLEPEKFKANFDDFLAAANEYDIGILPSLFEDCGVPPTEENMWTTDPKKAYAVNSPHKQDIVFNPERWEEPGKFVDWFMTHYKDDDHLLAIEFMNEPRMRNPSMKFARFLFQRGAAQRGTRPLTLGSCNLIDNMFFIEYGMDILQFHDNFPGSEEYAHHVIQQAEYAGDIMGKPVWMTEVQRIRQSGTGFGNTWVAEEELGPDLHSVMPIVHQYNVGFFFWGLMIKPAYLPNQRGKGTINGLFWEDGSVWSLDDARAVANDAALELPERHGWPEWGPPQDWRVMQSDGGE